MQAGKLDFAVLPLVFGVKRVPEFSLALLPGLIPNLATARVLKGSEVHAKLQAVAAAERLAHHHLVVDARRPRRVARIPALRLRSRA